MTKEHYHEARLKGQCPYCGVILPEGYRFAKCPDCLAKDRRVWHEKQKEIREKEVKPIIVPKREFISLDDMAKEAHEKHLTYGQLQKLETLKRRNEF